MGFFSNFKFGLNKAQGRMKLYDLERQQINLILNSDSMANGELNSKLLNLFFQMSNVAWFETSVQLFYSKHSIPVEMFRQAYTIAAFSTKNKYIKSKDSFLSNILFVDSPEEYESYILTIFSKKTIAEDGSELIDKSVIDLILEIVGKNYS